MTSVKQAAREDWKTHCQGDDYERKTKQLDNEAFG